MSESVGHLLEHRGQNHTATRFRARRQSKKVGRLGGRRVVAVGQQEENIPWPGGGIIVSVGEFSDCAIVSASSAISEGDKAEESIIFYIFHSQKKSLSDSTNRTI
jgi:hypothetical protein